MTHSKNQIDLLKQIGPYVEGVTHCRMRKGKQFSACIRASFSKAYEFALEAHVQREEKIAFFLVPSLRSICEDLIVLGYIAKMSKDDRENLIALLAQREYVASFESQAKFFKVIRPYQPVLSIAEIDANHIEDAVREIWRRNGWPRLTREYMPQVRQIAEKHHLDLLTTLYDYMYRLTSGMVHFNPQVLFRSGWGDLPVIKFSPRNFDSYYLAFAQTYGLLLFCAYFEFFGRFLRPGRAEREIVVEIRMAILSQARWPEMVTFEEMNQELPRGHDIAGLLCRLADADRMKHKMFAIKPGKSTGAGSGRKGG